MYAYQIWTVESRKRLALFPEIYKTEQEIKEAQKKNTQIETKLELVRGR